VNEEVRQVNRFLYPKRKDVITHYAQNTDTNYIVSPANIYTQLSLRMDSIADRIEQRLGDPEDYRVYVNQANLTVDVLYSDSASATGRPRDSWDLPASYMMLIREDKLDTFFASNELPSDTTAIVSSLSASEDESGKVSYSYTYDLSPLLTQQLRAEEIQDEIKFVLVPVSVVSNSSTGAITSVKQLQTISATRIRSAHNAVEPMDIEVVYAGFNKRR
jgi:hypothetical protein